MKRTLLTLAAAVSSLLSTAAYSQVDPASEAMLRVLRERHPSTQFTAVRPAQLPGLFEVQMGRNLAYTDESGRYFIFGSMFDMQERADLTAKRRAELGIANPEPQAQAPRPAAAPIEWSSLPLGDAIVTVKGNGRRKLAVFSDPECGFCKRLEPELEKLTDVTIYTFVFPLLGPNSAANGAAVWCAGTEKTRGALWSDLMVRGKKPQTTKACQSPMDRNLELARKLGVSGTPTMFSGDGRRLVGALPADRIDAHLNAPKQ